MFIHTPETALRSLAIQILCTSVLLRPLTPVQKAMQPVAMPGQLEALTRALHRVLALTPEQRDGMPSPDVDHVRELLVETVDVPDSLASLSVVPAPSACPQLEEPLRMMAEQLTNPVDDAAFVPAGRSLLLALLECQA